jgi:F-type H+-transporting ATPase subunit b
MVKKLRWVLPLLMVLSLTRPLLAADSGDQPGLISFDPGTAICVLISFVLLVVILYKAAWKNVLTALDGRAQRIGNDIKQAEEARAKAETLLKQHAAQLAAADEQVRQIMAKATTEAEKLAAGIKAQAQAEGESEREKTRKEIESAKRDAIRQVYEQTADMATAVAAKILGRNLNSQDQQDLVNQTLGQLEALGQK